MHNILIAGAGRIGTLIACLLAETKHYQVYLLDTQFNNTEFARLRKQFNNLITLEANAQDVKIVAQLIKKYHIQSIVSCLPYYCNVALAKLAKELQLNYFDLTEDIYVSKEIQQIAKNAKTVFMPHCGIAPGLVNIIANSLMQSFDYLGSAKLRVGALPQHADNALRYALTWSTEGLINEYINAGLAIENKQIITTVSLEGLEQLILDGVCYEAFNTSGGLGTLFNTYQGKINYLNYKTLRYPGHCEKMRFLLEDLKLKNNVKLLKTILENALPKTQEDIVVIYVAVNGEQNKQIKQEIFFKKIYPQIIAGIKWSAIQVGTAASACAVIDYIHANKKLRGFIRQEQVDLADIVNNPFNKYLQL